MVNHSEESIDKNTKLSNETVSGRLITLFVAKARNIHSSPRITNFVYLNFIH